MFTCCPECETTFRLSAADLRRAQGKVRCGECQTVFNALEFLAEESDIAESDLAEPGTEASDIDTAAEAANDNEVDTIISAAPDFAPTDDTDIHADDDDFDDDDSFDPSDPGAGILVTDSDDEHEQAAEDNNRYIADTDVGAETTSDQRDHNEPWITEGDYEDEELDDEIEFEIPPADTEQDDVATAWVQPFDDDEDEESAESEDHPDAGDQLDAELESPAEDRDEGEDEEFDDMIWERIPGVGSDTTDALPEDDPYIVESAISYNHETEWLPEDDDAFPNGDAELADEPPESDPAYAAATSDDEPVPAADDTAATTDQDSDTKAAESELEFDAPQDKWSSIFASTATWQKEPEEAPVSFAAFSEDSDTATTSGQEVTASQSEADRETPDVLSDVSDGGDTALVDEDDSSADDEEVWELPTDDAPWETPDGIADDDYDDEEPDSGEAEEDAAEQIAYFSEPDTETAAVDEALSEEDARDAERLPEEPPEGGYDVQHIVLADESEPEEDDEEAPPPWQAPTTTEHEAKPARTVPWLAGGLVLLALLAIQLLHYNRDTLATNAAWGTTIRNIYATAGLDLYPYWSLDNYEIRGSEAVAGESGADVMDIRAQIAAIGDQPVGLPYLRVVLRDRWSNPVAAKHFSPSDYARADELPASGQLKSGDTVSAHVSIIDPGSGAQGFELELCLPRRHTGMECSGKPFK